MNQAALNHEMTTLYTYVYNNDTAIVKLKAEKGDLKSAKLFFADKYLYIFGKEDLMMAEMSLVNTDSRFDYFEAQIPLKGIVLKYFFEVEDFEGEIAYLGADQIVKEKIEHFSKMYDFTRRAREEDGLHIPDWAKGAVVYQIFPERFHTGDDLPGNWYGPVSYNTKLGGTIKGITGKLDYLKDLGVDVVYMTPVFESPSNHKYNTTDYYNIDPDFGTKEDFRELVNTAHQMGMKVVIDGVFNHSGDTFHPFQDVLHRGEKSDYSEWFEIESFPLKQGSIETKPTYDAFAYHGSMPKLKTKNEQVTNYLLDVVTYWTREFHIDGWRLDVADEVSHEFWRAFRKKVRAINPEALIIGEVWYDSSMWLMGNEFDTVMNYKFFTPVIDFIAKKSINGHQFSEQVNAVRGLYPLPAYEVMWNLIDSHDTARFLHQAGEDIRRLKLAALVQMTFTGMPFIYYGDEVGLSGGEDPDCRRGMLWDQDKQNMELLSYYKKLIALRKSYPALMTGDFKVVESGDEYVVYEKYNENQIIKVILNNGEKELDMSIYKGCEMLLTDGTFDGRVAAVSGVVLFQP